MLWSPRRRGSARSASSRLLPQRFGRVGLLHPGRKALEVGHALLVVEVLVVVGAHHGVAREERAAERLAPAQLGIPPAVRHPNVPRLHGRLHGHLRNHLARGRGQLRPVTIGDAFLSRVVRVQEQARERATVAQHLDVALPGLEKRIFAHAGKHLVRVLVARAGRFAVVRQRIEAELTKDAGRQLNLPRRRGEPGLAILAELRRRCLHEGAGLEVIEGAAGSGQPVVEHVLDGLPGKVRAEAHPVRQVAPELEGAGGLLRRLHNFLRQREPIGPAPRVRDVVALAEDVAGQHVVGQHRGWRHEDLVRDDQLLVQHALVDLVLVGVAQQRVVAEHEERLYRIRGFRRHGAEHAGGVGHMAAHHLVGVRVAPNAFGRFFEHLRDPVGEHRELVETELLGLLSIRKPVVKTELGLGDVAVVEPAERLAAHNVEVAGDRTQDRVQTDRGRGRHLLIGDRCPRNDRAIGLRVDARGFGDLRFRHAGDGFHPLQGVLVHPRLELVKADAPIAHEVGVVKPLVEDDLQPAQAHRRVGSGAQTQVQVRGLRLIGHPGIKHDHLRSPAARRVDGVVDRGPGVLGACGDQARHGVSSAVRRRGDESFQNTDTAAAAAAQRGLDRSQ